MPYKTLLLDLGQFNSFYLQDACYSWHNHGLGLIASSTKGVDYAGLKYLSGFEELSHKVKDYDIIGISMMSSDYPQLIVSIDVIKEVNPNCKIIVGGIGVTVSPDLLLKNPKIDYILTGEGEITLPKFLNNPKDFGRVIKGESVKHLDALPFLDRSIYPFPLERNVEGWGDNPMATIITSRGCPYNCSFCQPAERNHFGSRVRRRSAEDVIQEINELIYKYSPKFLVFYDDSFMTNPKWLKEFIKSYQGIPFLASARADFVCENPSLVYMLKDIGMKVISIGFESGSQRILDMVGKKTTVLENYSATKICGEAGIKIFANIMYGFPTETKIEQRETQKLCNFIKGYDSMISPAYFTPFPGSYLGDECIEKGLSLIDENTTTRFGRNKIKGVDYDFLDSFVWS